MIAGLHQDFVFAAVQRRFHIGLRDLLPIGVLQHLLAVQHRGCAVVAGQFQLGRFDLAADFEFGFEIGPLLRFGILLRPNPNRLGERVDGKSKYQGGDKRCQFHGCWQRESEGLRPKCGRNGPAWVRGGWVRSGLNSRISLLDGSLAPGSAGGLSSTRHPQSMPLGNARAEHAMHFKRVNYCTKFNLMETKGIEPSTPALQRQCSPN